MLELRSLLLAYPGFSLSADLAIGPGSRTAIIGPSGAGKSTLLAAIAGFLTPTTGRIFLNGTDITARPPGDRNLSMVFQDQNLFPHMTAFDNVALALSPNLRLSAADRVAVNTALERTGLDGLGARRPSELSGGQQARVTLARTLLQSSDYILMDEPFAALGPGLRAEMLSLVEGLCNDTGKALLMVTHDPKDAETLCPDTIVVAEGRAEPPAPTAQLLSDPPPGLAAYLGR